MLGKREIHVDSDDGNINPLLPNLGIPRVDEVSVGIGSVEREEGSLRQ